MTETIQVLRKCMIFRDIPEEVLREQILPQGKSQEFPKGKYIFMPQERVDYFGLVLSGKVNTLHVFPDGSCGLTDVLEPGELVGSDLVWTRSREAPYHALAASPATLLLFPDAMVTESGLLPEDCRAEIIVKFLRQISQDNMRKDYRLAILSQKGLRERIMTYLTMQANKRKTASFTIPFSRDELADYLCVNRSALSHELSRMRGEGLISFRKNQFSLPGWEGERPC